MIETIGDFVMAEDTGIGLRLHSPKCEHGIFISAKSLAALNAFAFRAGVLTADNPKADNPFVKAVEMELKNARHLHANINSIHEGYAVILEELDEFWGEVKKKKSMRDRSKMLAELVQIAAMAQRCAEDCL